MSRKVAFIGFRHGHINGLYAMLKESADAEIVGACEEDAEARAALEDSPVTITHDSYAAMLAEVECDIVACGDYYAIRGERVIQALEAGKHVMVDKPLCTRLDELERIEALARDKGLRVSCMLDMVDSPVFTTLRRVIQEGTIGEVHTVHFNGQHPLNYGARPQWYFEEGKHGGTINDIAIHAVDAIPWLTGQDVVEVTAARAWNARLKECSSFQDAAVLMLRLANGGAATGDVSYLTPEAQGYTFPVYWRFTLFGSDGVAETAGTWQRIDVYRKDKEGVQAVAFDPGRPGGYWEDFLADMDGDPNPGGLDMDRVLRSSRIALQAQHAADTGSFPVSTES